MRADYQRARKQRGADESASRAQEARYRQQHTEASRRRRMAAKGADAQKATTGDIIGWYGILDDRTTPDCKAAIGKNFKASNPPAVGLPGAVHNECRCWPGPPHRGAGLLPASSVDAQPTNMNDLIRRVARSARQSVERFFGRENR